MMWPPYVLATGGVLLALYQVSTVPSAGEIGAILSQLEHIGLVGALGAGLIFLWRAYTKKDEALLTATKQMTDAIAASSDANKLVVETNRQMVRAIGDLQLAIAQLPCTGHLPHAAGTD